MRSRNFNRKISNSSGRSRTAEYWIAGPLSYPLDHEGLVERITLDLPDEGLVERIILDLPDEL
jgi:hypothetical protein